MPRTARIVATEMPHHITQRGNRKAEVFLDDDDRERYLRLLRKYARKYGLETHAYCLMSNHIHLVAIPMKPHSMARALGYANMCYTQYFNRKYSLSGHLWQGRFFSCALDERHALAAVRYAECNPVRAGLVGRAWDYKWSSARGHIGEGRDPILSKNWPSQDMLAQWKELLTESESVDDIEELRRCTRADRPLGSPSFIRKLEKALSRPLRRKRVGPPRKPSLRRDKS